MKKIYFILIAVLAAVVLTSVLISCRNDAIGPLDDETIVDDEIIVDELPEDPGIAGTLTVEGIDSDNDGVRDDVQRHIALEVEKEVVREILMDYARGVQKYMVSDEEMELMRDDIIADFNKDVTAECLFLADPENAYDIGMSIEGIVLNTEDRILAASRAYGLYNDKFPTPLSAEEIDAACRKYLNN